MLQKSRSRSRVSVCYLNLDSPFSIALIRTLLPSRWTPKRTRRAIYRQFQTNITCKLSTRSETLWGCAGITGLYEKLEKGIRPAGYADAGETLNDNPICHVSDFEIITFTSLQRSAKFELDAFTVWGDLHICPLNITPVVVYSLPWLPLAADQLCANMLTFTFGSKLACESLDTWNVDELQNCCNAGIPLLC